MVGTRWAVAVLAMLVPGGARAGEWNFREAMVPMRDGVTLQTVILEPTHHAAKLPILLRRTPYGVPSAPYPALPPGLRQLAEDGYIFVIQNLRGRFKSGGKFSLSGDVTLLPDGGTIETRDAYDTVEWLTHNVPGGNGKVGIFGVSYDGYTAAATLLHPHPALKAVSEQASPVDQWMNDDDHRYGALRLSYAFEYAVMEEADPNANTNFTFDTYDTYAWYLKLGPLGRANDVFLHGKIPYWNETMAHPDYDAFWRAQAWLAGLKGSTVPNLNVAGFWDQEDPWGPWQIWRRAAAHDPDHTNLMVAGPWIHGGWRREASKLGVVPLGEDTGLSFRRDIERPFFAHWLHGKGEAPAWKVATFQTGSNAWRRYTAWPPAGSTVKSLYLHNNGTLDWAPEKDAGGHRDYVSDPANPVPYRARPISPTYPGGDWREWEMQDQRFVDGRPDVLTYTSAPLGSDVTVTGEVSAEIWAASGGSDADLVVKLIDVFPENDVLAPWSDELGPAPGEYRQSVNGLELPVAMEVRRGRYLDDYTTPHALVPGQKRLWAVPLRDRDHVFRAGHRIMVQIQSTWFPLIDRNPQSFVASIPRAKEADFKAVRMSVYGGSRVLMSVVK